MSTGFGAGMRHYRIGILEVVQSEKTFGATTSYRRAGKVSAAYKFNKGAKALREGALDAYNTVMFQLNFSSNINITRDCLVEFRGKIFQIQSLNDDYQANKIVITATEMATQVNIIDPSPSSSEI
jgi:SPP1 family predicted phage head-tail adaptor